MGISLHVKFEQAVRMLAEALPVSAPDSRKPVLFHDIRVGVHLYERGYPDQVVLAGVLHDALEFSSLTEEVLRKEFGDEVVRIVRANTKDDSIADKEEKIRELIQRCAKAGEDALIVKAADIIDSFTHYSQTDNEGELKYCMRNANAIFTYKPAEYKDTIFDELKTWQGKFAYLMK